MSQAESSRSWFLIENKFLYRKFSFYERTFLTKGPNIFNKRANKVNKSIGLLRQELLLSCTNDLQGLNSYGNVICK